MDAVDLRALAASHRDAGVPQREFEDYDDSLRSHWGGPGPRHFPQAMQLFPLRHSKSRGKTALITGGTSGIGFYAAKLLAAIGFTLILPSRPGLEHEADGAVSAIKAAVPDATVLVPTVGLDLASFRSVREFGAHLRAERSTYKRIDALLLNAGRGGGVHDTHDTTEDGHEAIMQVNLYSHALLTSQLVPLLADSPYARVCLHSSSARFNAQPSQLDDLKSSEVRLHPWATYSLSKAAMCPLARALNVRLPAAGVTGAACVADPGLAATGVNVQHELARSIGHRGGTKQLHDEAAVHAADGALPLVLAALEGKPNEMYRGDGRHASSVESAAFSETRETRHAGTDPYAWGTRRVEMLAAQLGTITGWEWTRTKREL